jgi:hypothetical protein
MATSSPYLRPLVLGAVWFAAVALKMVSRHPGHWSTYPPRNFVVLVIAWIITALVVGAVATRWERLYGAYIGEVFRRRSGGSWAADHPIGGEQSYPLTTKSNGTMFPVGWCWKRLTVGEEDNVYHKAMLFWQPGNLLTNAAPDGSLTIQIQTGAEPVGGANGSQPVRPEGKGTSTVADPRR